jgi:exonuclease SbcC
MKILAIRGKNLASLADEFEIDFTKEPLLSSGIFAITGDTGAGKSTILDALCVALFNNAPRFNSGSTDVRIDDITGRSPKNIMRRDASECYAEVDYIGNDGRKYMSRWSLSRGLRKGKVQTAKMFLRSPDGIEADRLDVVPSENERFLGLNYEQFTKTVLLAQNDFAQFLKANTGEKSEILEKITGTETYTRISQKIYEHSSFADNQCKLLRNEIDSIEILGDDELKSVQDKIVDGEKLIKQLTADDKEAEKKAEWLVKDKSIQSAVEEAERNWTAAQKANEAAAPRREHLKLLDLVQGIRSVFISLQADSKLNAENEKKIKQSRADLSEVAASLAEKRKQFEAKKAEKTAEDKAFDALHPSIVEARKLDGEISNADSRCGELNQKIKAYLTEIEGYNNNLKSIEEAIARDVATIKAEKQWQSENAEYEAILSDVSLIIQNINSFILDSGSIKSDSFSLEKVHKTLVEKEKRKDVLKGILEELEHELPKELAYLRERLVEGEPCPLCGSRHHDVQALRQTLEIDAKAIEERKNKRQDELDVVEKEISTLNSQISGLEVKIAQADARKSAIYADLALKLGKLPVWKADATDFDLLKSSVGKNCRKWNESKKSLDDSVSGMKNREELHSSSMIELEKRKVELQNVEKLFKELSESLRAMRERRAGLLGGRNADDVERAHKDKVNDLTAEIETIEAAYNALVQRDSELRGVIGTLSKSIDDCNVRIADNEEKFRDWVARNNFTHANELPMLFSVSTDDIDIERKALEKLSSDVTSADITMKERVKNRSEHEALPERPDAGVTLASLKRLRDGLNATLTEKSNEVNGLRGRLAVHEANVSKSKDKRKMLAEAEKESADWSALSSIFGSADGKKFRTKVQGYTLKVLLEYANANLAKLYRRYRLEPIPGSLQISVIDEYMAGEPRPCNSLSGGELFVVSLALALGLSSLSSNQMNIDSLFIDEGFGALDDSTLSTVMDMLENLHGTGRKVGVISHVAELNERIATKIHVIKNGSSSHIEIV